MNRNIIIALTCLLALPHTSCRADALDDLLKQLEEAELKPAAKKAPASAPKAASKQPSSKKRPSKKRASKKQASRTQASKSQKRSLKKQPPATYRSTNKSIMPQKTTQEFLEKTPTATRKDKGISKREQRINTFFQTKISPIAEGMFKLVESKETQQLVETAKKKRLEHEKATAAKVGKGIGAKPRYSQVGGSGGRGGTGGWGGAGKGYDSGYGGFGGHGGAGSGGWSKGSWAPSSSSSSSHGFESPAPKADSLKAGGTSTQDKKEKEDTLTRTKSTDKDELSAEKQRILNLNEGIQKTLNLLLEKLDGAPTNAAKQKVFTTIQDKITKLKSNFTTRAAALSDDSKLPPAENKSLREQIKNQEEGKWNRLRKEDPAFEAHIKAKVVKNLIDPQMLQILQSQEVVDRAGVAAVGAALSDPVKEKLQSLRDSLAQLDTKFKTGALDALEKRLAHRLAHAHVAAVYPGPLPLATQIGDVNTALDGINPAFFSFDLHTAIEDFFAPTP